MKNTPIKKSKRLLTKPAGEGVVLEKEIEELIDREKTKGKIMSKLLNKTIQPTLKQIIE